MDSKKGVGDGGGVWWGGRFSAGTPDIHGFLLLLRLSACACHHRRENERGPHNIGAGAGGSHIGLIMAVTFCLMRMQCRFHESERFSVGCQLGPILLHLISKAFFSFSFHRDIFYP